MWIDISPLKNNPNFRNLYLGQTISFFGSMLSMVAIPYQVYELTESTLFVGLLGVAELVPLLVTAFIGGALADTMDRKKLILRSEMGMMLGCLVLMVNALLPEPQVWLLFVMASLLSALNGFHRPALDAMVPNLISHHEIQSVSVLTALKYNVGTIGGPALAGFCIATFGTSITFALDFLSFFASLWMLSKVDYLSPSQKLEGLPSIKSIVEAIKYAWKRPELLGSYAVDFLAMVFGMPNALFPAFAHTCGGAKVVGWLYAAPSIGALLLTLISAWTKKIRRHGAGIAVASVIWGFAVTAFGLSPNLGLALFFLTLAGAADCLSGIFRTTLWNETIPDNLRGRMAGLEMISYMSGPLLGNAEAGLIASISNTEVSIISGGILSILAVVVCTLLLPRFWKYEAPLPATRGTETETETGIEATTGSSITS